MPGSLEDALVALEKDHSFLLKGDVFTEELLSTYVDYKRTKKWTRCACGPTRMSLLCTTIFSA